MLPEFCIRYCCQACGQSSRLPANHLISQARCPGLARDWINYITSQHLKSSMRLGCHLHPSSSGLKKSHTCLNGRVSRSPVRSGPKAGIYIQNECWSEKQRNGLPFKRQFSHQRPPWLQLSSFLARRCCGMLRDEVDMHSWKWLMGGLCLHSWFVFTAISNSWYKEKPVRWAPDADSTISHTRIYVYLSESFGTPRALTKLRTIHP